MRYKVIAQYHPAAALHQPRLWGVMLSDWENFPTEVPHDYIITKEHKIYPETISLDTELSPNGGLGEWSVAYRNEQGKLAVERYAGSRPNKVFNADVVFHNAKFDLRVLRANRMQKPKGVHDTMIQAYCLGMGRQSPTDSSKEKSGSMMVGGLGLKYLARRHLGMEMKTWQEVRDHPEMKAEYNDNDSVATFLLDEKWRPILPKHYFNIDMPLLDVLMTMEDRGIAIDSGYLDTFSKGLEKQLGEIDLPINPNSPQQIQSYVYGTLGIEPWKFTETGLPSTDADVLESIDDPVIKDILKYRDLNKDKTTYMDNYVTGSKVDGRIHAEFKQTSTATGRLSCANPNLQNVPRDGDMRKLFIAAEGKKLVVLDYKQLEFIVLAAITQDPVILKLLNEGYDFHTMTSMITGKSRTDIKPANFATIYGAQAWTISRELGITTNEAKDLQNLIFTKMPGIKQYIDHQRQVAREERKVINFFGRTRRLDAMYAPDWRVKQEGEREAINTPIQGAAGEVVKLAMIDLHYTHSAPMLLQVHDELVFEIPEKEAEDYAQWLREYVPKITLINGVEFPVEVGVGNNWFEAKKEAK
uniref:Putative DNA polymerase n=2 Tax=viral metagenome TaxID=1070528 RepID=A0A6M3JPV4_9ZZZZ